MQESAKLRPNTHVERENNQNHRPTKNRNHRHTHKQVAKRTGPLTIVQRRVLETQSQTNKTSDLLLVPNTHPDLCLTYVHVCVRRGSCLLSIKI